jgi:outer membrane protein assembly factor BamB
MSIFSRIQGFIILVMTLAPFISANGQDAQWLGPNRNGVFPDTLLLKEWPAEGPAVRFATAGIGKGFSSAVATTDNIYITGNKDTIEYLTCMDHAGKILWQKPYGRCWTKSYPEARCTPTVDEDRIYVLSGLDNLVCFQAKTGAEIWSVDIHKEYQSSWDMFGVSESILLIDNKVIVTPAGETTTVIALDKMTGKPVWQSESLHAHRSNMSPIAINHVGKKYIITSTQTHMLGVDAIDGKILWTYHYNFLDKNGDNATIFTNSPVYQDSCLWISNGWDVKSVMLEIAPDGKTVSEKFADHTFDNQNHGVVLVDSFLYGSNFTGRQSGKWICMNWKTGEITWIADFHNKGPIIAADGMLYCYEEKGGNIALVKADPKEFKVTSTFKVKSGTGPHWAHPAIYYGMLLVRHGDYLVAYDIREGILNGK